MNRFVLFTDTEGPTFGKTYIKKDSRFLSDLFPHYETGYYIGDRDRQAVLDFVDGSWVQSRVPHGVR